MATIPIQSLFPNSDPPSHASIRAVVTLSWPYSSSTRQCALLLADPDFRLRNARGQVRVRFTGPSAEAVAKSHVGIGDEVVLELEGAQWEAAREVERTPGKSVEGELVFRRRLDLKILGNGTERIISLNAPASPPPTVETPVPRPVRSLRTSLDGSGYSDGVPIYSSPAFAKRLRLSIESSSFLSDTIYDPFTEDVVESSTAKAKQRRSLGEVRQWRFADRTPSPEKGFGLDGPMDLDEHDADGSTAAVRGDAASAAAATSSDFRALRGGNTPKPAQASFESSQEASGNASAILLQDSDKTPPPFRQRPPSYESDTEEDEELYTRTPPRVRSVSPSHRLAILTSAGSAAPRTTGLQEKSTPIAAPTRSGPETPPVQVPISKTEQSALRKQSSSTFNKTTALQTETPAKARTAISSSERVSAGTTPLPALATTPQSEKDRVMSATFRSLFGFRTSPEAQSSPIQPIEVSTPTPKASWSNMGRKSLEDNESDVANEEVGLRSLPSLTPHHHAAATDKPPHISSEAKPMQKTWSVHPTPAQGTAEPASPGGTTEADTEADDDFHQPEDSIEADFRHTEEGPPPQSDDTESRSSQDISKDSLQRPGLASQTSVLAPETGISHDADVVDSSRSSVLLSSQKSRLPETIDLDPSSDADQDIAIQAESANGSVHVLQGNENNAVVQDMSRSTEPIYAAPAESKDVTEDTASEQVGMPTEAYPPRMPLKSQLEMLQDQQETMKDRRAIASYNTDPTLPPAKRNQSFSSPIAEPASETVMPLQRDIISRPAAQSEFKRVKFPTERVVEDSQSEQAGTLSTQQTPEASDDEQEHEVIAVPVREQPTDHARVLEEGGKDKPSIAARTSESADDLKPATSSVQPTVIELSSSSPIEDLQPLEQQPSQELEAPPLPGTTDAAQELLHDFKEFEQVATDPSAASRDGIENENEEESMIRSSTAPVPSEAHVGHLSGSENVETFLDADAIASSTSQALTNSVNEIHAGSQGVSMAPGSSEEQVMEGVTLAAANGTQRTDSPEQVWHLPGGMVATFSSSALFPTSPLHSQLQHEGPNITPWGETLQGGMDGEGDASTLPSTSPLTQVGGATTHIGSSLHTSRAVSEVHDVMSNVSTELSMEAQLEPEVQAHEQISDKWEASAQRTAAMLGLTQQGTDDEPSNEPTMTAANGQSRAEAHVAYPEVHRSGRQPDQQSQEKANQDHEDTKLAVSADPITKSTDSNNDSRPAGTVDQESASAAEQRKMPSRKSLKARLSNVPEVISAWFSPKRTPNQNASTNEESNGHSGTTAAPTNGQSAAIATPPRLTRGQSTGFTTSNGYFTPLASLERHLNPASQTEEVDVLAVVTDFTSLPRRAQGGPRDYYTVFKISDSSLDLDGSVHVEVFRAWKAVLPVAEVGDVVLLRGFSVKSKKRQPYLLSAEVSAWCVWRYAELARLESQASVSSKLDGRPHVREEVHGPPVEFGEEERAIVMGLRQWFEETHPEAAKGQAADGTSNAHNDMVVHDDGDDEMAYQPISPGLAAKS
ncbi:Telomeric single stranded DNA binding POT1/CDC13 [Teratosphaeria destructans]|uniref:Telomeric single stranded DNA binding POT1/CDC13 n=1 Tax=Teratosphaeria destructans TaxID=418781 RepID=A0A9W7SLR5_9PEZI|nr:Telomeric single stranded DNA binding POT1/CDC13 [Teratosphaeria destructans]